MSEKTCFEFTVKDRVQDAGLRLAIAKQIPDELNVRTDNLPDGSVRVVVRGQEQEVRKFWEELQKQTLDKAENPTFSEPVMTEEIPIDTNRFFHKLESEQLGKFVDVGLDMGKDMKDMTQEMSNMGNEMSSMRKEITSGFKELVKTIKEK